jgi:hypothetical protein
MSSPSRNGPPDSQSRRTYFPIEEIDSRRDYFALSLLSDDGVTPYSVSHCTTWVDFKQVNGKRAEIRQATPVIAQNVARSWRLLDEPFFSDKRCRQFRGLVLSDRRSRAVRGEYRSEIHA